MQDIQNAQTIFSEQLINSYNKVRGKSTETVDIMTGLLCSTNNFRYAQIRAIAINHLQGRNRRPYINDKDQPMPLFRSEDNDEKSTEKWIRNLNVYLADKHNLRGVIHKEIIDQVKSMVVILLQCRLFEVIENLNLPDYIKPHIDTALNNIIKEQKRVLEDWISYLKDSGNGFLVDVVEKRRDNFWKNSKGSPLRIFSGYFRAYKDKINNWDELYRMFLFYRNEYNNLTNNMKLENIFNLFNISRIDYGKAKATFIKDFIPIIKSNGEGNTVQIQELAYEY